jgi:hypothetical protein
VIAFGCAITDQDAYERLALPGFRLAGESDSVIVSRDSSGTVSRTYNEILDSLPETVDALVLAHQDVEITNPGFTGEVRRCLEHPEVALVGALGALNVTSIAWWDPGPMVGDYRWKFSADGGGVVSTDDWDSYVPATGVHEVDAIDGMVIVFSRWAIEHLRFDEDIDPSAHGYDVDISFQARAAGKAVVVGRLDVTHHHEISLMDDRSDWIAAHMRFAEKWEGRSPGPPLDERWPDRARRAEAQAGAEEIRGNELGILRNQSIQRAVAGWNYAQELEERLKAGEHARQELERELARIEDSLAWRMLQRAKRLVPGAGSGRARDEP